MHQRNKIKQDTRGHNYFYSWAKNICLKYVEQNLNISRSWWKNMRTNQNWMTCIVTLIIGSLGNANQFADLPSQPKSDWLQFLPRGKPQLSAWKRYPSSYRAFPHDQRSRGSDRFVRAIRCSQSSVHSLLRLGLVSSFTDQFRDTKVNRNRGIRPGVFSRRGRIFLRRARRDVFPLARALCSPPPPPPSISFLTSFIPRQAFLLTPSTPMCARFFAHDFSRREKIYRNWCREFYPIICHFSRFHRTSSTRVQFTPRVVSRVFSLSSRLSSQ